jgi:hypothetical protein
VSRPALGTGTLSRGVKRLGREPGYSPPSSVEVKNGCVIPPLPHTPSVKPRGEFTFAGRKQFQAEGSGDFVISMITLRVAQIQGFPC